MPGLAGGEVKISFPALHLFPTPSLIDEQRGRRLDKIKNGGKDQGVDRLFLFDLSAVYSEKQEYQTGRQINR